MRILLFVIIFFALGALFIISNNNLALYEDENFKKFSYLYTNWLDGLYLNIQTLTGNVAVLEWIPKNTENGLTEEVDVNDTE